jgi:hypothetical protein
VGSSLNLRFFGSSIMAAPHSTVQLPAEVRDVLNNLRIADGQHRLTAQAALAPVPPAPPLRVRDTDRTAAAGWVCTLILNAPTRKAHFAHVRALFRGAPEVTQPWRIIDPFGLDPATDPDTALPGRALDAACAGPDGPGGWTPEELALLLLDEDTLANFALLIHDLMPDWWLGALTTGPAPVHLPEPEPEPEPEEESFTGDVSNEEELEEMFAWTQQPGSGKGMERTGPAVWEITLDPATRANFARTVYGNEKEAFTLRLHRLSDGRAELEMTPPPRKADVVLPATFRTGATRTFVVAVPPEAKVPGARWEAIRKTTRSAPCAALPAEAFTFTSVELRSEGGVIRLVLR